MSIFASVLLRLAETGNSSAASELVKVLHDSTFNINTFKTFIGSLKDCEEVSLTNLEEVTNDN